MKIVKNFIVLEGIDGSGTTTLLKNLEKSLSQKDFSLFSTCEPTDMPTGKLIRSILQGKWSVQGETLAELFSADRREHLYQPETGVVNLCRQGKVISDRYMFSSLAYQSLQCSWEKVWQLNRNFPLPEKLIFLDLPALTAQKRILQRGEDSELFDDLSTQEKIARNYLRCLDQYRDSPMKILKLDGTNSPQKLTEEALHFILS